MGDSIKEFESLKNTIEELKVKRLSDLREKERLEKEFEDLKTQIKEVYGCEITDFEKAISELKISLDNNLRILKEKINECKSKMEIK